MDEEDGTTRYTNGKGESINCHRLDGKIYAIGGGKAYPADAFATVEESTPEVSATAISPQGKLAMAWGKIKRWDNTLLFELR